MKRNLILLAAAAGVLAGCARTETVGRSSENAIRFDGAYVGNAVASRAVEETTLDGAGDSFQVFGQYGTTQIFNNVPVTKQSDDSWTYTGGDRIWIEGQNYLFSAYAPADAIASPAVNDQGYLSIGTYDAGPDNQHDLIYAAQSAVGQTSGNSEVTFVFNHLLSWVRLTIDNQIASIEGHHVTISDLQLTNVNTKNDWTTNNTVTSSTEIGGSWGTASEKSSYELVSSAEELAAGKNTYDLVTVPQGLDGDMKVTFTITLTLEGVADPLTAELEATIPNTTVSAWEQGNRYNYTATVTYENIEGIEPIVFGDPTVQSWEEAEMSDDGSLTLQ